MCDLDSTQVAILEELEATHFAILVSCRVIDLVRQILKGEIES